MVGFKPQILKGGGMGMIESRRKETWSHPPRTPTEFPPQPPTPKTLLSSHPFVLLNWQFSPPSFQSLPLLDLQALSASKCCVYQL